MSFRVTHSGAVLHPISYTLYTVVQLVTRVEMLSGGRLLALGDEGGGISVADLRMLGASDQGAPFAHTMFRPEPLKKLLLQKIDNRIFSYQFCILVSTRV